MESSWRTNVVDFGLSGQGWFGSPGECKLASRSLANPSVIVMGVRFTTVLVHMQCTIPSGSSPYVFGLVVHPPGVHFPFGVPVQPDVH